MRLDALRSGIMDESHRGVIDADVSEYFDSIDHGYLRSFLDLRIKDAVVRRMIDKRLTVLAHIGRSRTRIRAVRSPRWIIDRPPAPSAPRAAAPLAHSATASARSARLPPTRSVRTARRRRPTPTLPGADSPALPVAPAWQPNGAAINRTDRASRNTPFSTARYAATLLPGSSKSREPRSSRACSMALEVPWALSMLPFSCALPRLLRVGRKSYRFCCRQPGSRGLQHTAMNSSWLAFRWFGDAAACCAGHKVRSFGPFPLSCRPLRSDFTVATSRRQSYDGLTPTSRSTEVVFSNRIRQFNSSPLSHHRAINQRSPAR